MSVVFDKLSFMRHLESEGTFARPQAEKLSEAFHQAVQETVATREDIARLEARIDGMDARVDAKLATVDAKLVTVDAKLAAVDAKLGGVDAKLGAVEARVDSRLAEMDATFASLKVWIAGVGVALFTALSAIRFFGH